MKHYFIIVCITLFGLAGVHHAQARDLRMVIAHISGKADPDTQGRPSGHFVELARAMDRVYTEGTIQVLGIFPFKRCLLMVKNGLADVHMPLARPGQTDEPGLVYSTVPIGKLADVLYTRADSPALDINFLDTLSIDVIRGNTHSDKDNVGEVSTIESGLLKVVKGRVDGFIVPQDEADPYIRAHRLKNLRRQLYRQLPVHLIFRQGEAAQELDRMFSGIIKQLNEEGTLGKIMDKIHRPYEDWQPYQMDW